MGNIPEAAKKMHVPEPQSIVKQDAESIKALVQGGGFISQNTATTQHAQSGSDTKQKKLTYLCI